MTSPLKVVFFLSVLEKFSEPLPGQQHLPVISWAGVRAALLSAAPLLPGRMKVILLLAEKCAERARRDYDLSKASNTQTAVDPIGDDFDVLRAMFARHLEQLQAFHADFEKAFSRPFP